MKLTLTTIEKDVLKEIGNIGAGNATTSMSQLTNKKILMGVPEVKVIPFDDVLHIVGGPEKLVVGMYFRIFGEAPGTVYFLLSVEEAESIIKDVTGGLEINLLSSNNDNKVLGLSALQEVGNIITGSYLSALADFTNLNMQSSIPYLSIDMAGAILSVGLIELSQRSDYAIVIDTQLEEQSGQNGFSSQFFFLPDIDTVPKLFNALGIDKQ